MGSHRAFHPERKRLSLVLVALNLVKQLFLVRIHLAPRISVLLRVSGRQNFALVRHSYLARVDVMLSERDFAVFQFEILDVLEWHNLRMTADVTD